jgi:hypothetical protein
MAIHELRPRIALHLDRLAVSRSKQGRTGDLRFRPGSFCGLPAHLPGNLGTRTHSALGAAGSLGISIGV